VRRNIADSPDDLAASIAAQADPTAFTFEAFQRMLEQAAPALPPAAAQAIFERLPEDLQRTAWRALGAGGAT